MRLNLTRAEWNRLAGFYGAIALLHALGGGLVLRYAAEFPALIGLGLGAYLLGLRHAFDADHIVAIDDTVRYLLQKRSLPLGVGFFFSLGHSTVVLVIAVASALAAARLKHQLPALQHIGAVLGSAVSATFLLLIGLLNLAILRDLIAARRGWVQSGRDHAHAPRERSARGMITWLLGRRWLRVVSHSGQMYPVGLLFGLGFDTASEIALIAMTAASGSAAPLAAVLSLPLLFAAGMLTVDTTDGVLMSRAYSWALGDPLRRLTYNVVVTCTSACLALTIGGVQGAYLISRALKAGRALPSFLDVVDSSVTGSLIAFLLLLAWGLSVWMARRREAAAAETLDTRS